MKKIRTKKNHSVLYLFITILILSFISIGFSAFNQNLFFDEMNFTIRQVAE